MIEFCVQDRETGEWSAETYTMEELASMYQAQEITVRVVQPDGIKGEPCSITPGAMDEPPAESYNPNTAKLWAIIKRNLLMGWTDWHGRATRREFWVLWFATGIIYWFLLSAIQRIFYELSCLTKFGGSFETLCIIVFDAIVSAALFVPVLSCSVRRYHDAGISGRWLLYCSPLYFLTYSVFLAPFSWSLSRFCAILKGIRGCYPPHNWFEQLYEWFNWLYYGGRYDICRNESSPLLTSILFAFFLIVFIFIMRDSKMGSNQWGVSPKYGEDGTKCPPVNVASAGMFKLTGLLFSKAWSDWNGRAKVWFNWNGRATRREFWLGGLGLSICMLPLFVLRISDSGSNPMQLILEVVSSGVGLVVFGIVGWKAVVWRLHDTGRPGLWALLPLSPLLLYAVAYVIIWLGPDADADILLGILFIIVFEIAYTVVSVVFTVLMCLDSMPGTNKYGHSVKYPFPMQKSRK